MASISSDQEVIQGVTNTLLDYCRLLDEKRVDEFAALFTEDCVFEEGKPAVGRAHVRAKVRKLLKTFDALSHHLSNIRVTPTGPDTADALSYIYAWHRLTDGGQLEIWGRYVDQLKLDGDRWRIHHRVVQVQGWKGLDELPLARVPQAALPEN